MPKVKSPLLSVSASGKIGNDIIYTSWKGQPRVIGLRLEKRNKFWLSRKKYFSQSEGQQAIRGTFKKAIIEWRKLSVAEKKVWKDIAKKIQNTAVGLFVQDWIDNFYNRNQFKLDWLFSVGLGRNIFLFKPEYIESYLTNRYVKK